MTTYRWFPIPDLIGDGRNGKNKIPYEPVQLKELHDSDNLNGVRELIWRRSRAPIDEQAIVQLGGQILVKEVEEKK